MATIGQRDDRFTLELKFNIGGLDTNALHDAFRGQEPVDLVFMGKTFKVRLDELSISHDMRGTETSVSGSVLYD